ncbi:MAG: hypothetical protein DRP89_01640 [Candidatus Neomarinimicrobiota bacterium]|nr:MAG: hypothetical protein DRP89_01640 [Candidatus Neomarinimicrobiota bacterium]
MNNEDIKELVKESVREVLRDERLTLYEVLIPYVTKKELQEIDKKYGLPENYDEEDFVDMTDWVKQ